ncbi:hypothetical protein EHS39_09105 [Ensifer sp. MPMI2T]|nr:hypothetical protein EHS39_09105 [Ensifer sp. MPMI2T]
MSKAYYSRVTGFVNNVHRNVGDPVGILSEQEAKYLVMAGLITDEPPVLERPRRARSEPKAEPVATEPEKVGE